MNAVKDSECLTLKDLKGMSLEQAEREVKELCLHAGVLKTFPTVMTTLAEQLDEKELYNALYDVAYIQSHFVNDVLLKLDGLEEMISLLNGGTLSYHSSKQNG